MFLKIQKLTLHQDIKSNWHIQIRSLVCPPWRNKPKQSLHSRLKSQICRRVLHFFGSHRRYNTFRYLKTWFFQGSALKVYLDNDFLSLFRLSEIIIPFSQLTSRFFIIFTISCRYYYVLKFTISTKRITLCSDWGFLFTSASFTY